MSNVYKKICEARTKFHSLKLEKTGFNKFAGYKYFELGDFLIPALTVFGEVGLCAIVSFDKEIARMTIIDTESPEGQRVVIESPMGSAALKGCHEVQNIGAVETYQRRYLWVAALEIVEHDALDATAGKADEKGVKTDFKSSPTMGIFESLPAARKAIVTDVAETIKELFAKDDVVGAYEEACGLTDSEERTALWSLLDSKTRATIKKYSESLKQKGTS